MFVHCPECGAPAEITEVVELQGTQGPISMAQVVGSCGRNYFMPELDLQLMAEPERQGDVHPQG